MATSKPDKDLLRDAVIHASMIDGCNTIGLLIILVGTREFSKRWSLLQTKFNLFPDIFSFVMEFFKRCEKRSNTIVLLISFGLREASGILVLIMVLHVVYYFNKEYQRNNKVEYFKNPNKNVLN